ncbi:MAG: iron-containing alcohol dehydrogenase [Rikenellaceae bacterium]|nr:iron-containing alcohol dehydrogenase [Rikenellaceae bacterium]
MIDFAYYNPAKIIFGKKSIGKTGALVKEYGKKVLLHYGGGSIKKNGVYDAVVESLESSGIEFVELGGVVPNPRLSLVNEGIKICRDNSVDFILAVGGGSVIDSAKAIAAGVDADNVWDYFIDGSKKINSALPIGVVLTIPAAGSESSPASVITNEEGKYKRSIHSESVIPKFAVMNPEVTYTMPLREIANGYSDIIAHLMERYFTNVKNVDLTDRLIEANMRTILYYGPMAMKEPENYDVRAEIMWGGTIAHNNLLNTGRIGDWASHEIEHELSAEYDIAHGAGLSIIFPAWMKYVNSVNPDKFVQFAERVFDVSLAYDDKSRIINEMIERLENWYKSMGLPVRLSDLGIGEDKLRAMAEKCVENRGTVGQFKKLNADDIYNIYILAL